MDGGKREESAWENTVLNRETAVSVVSLRRGWGKQLALQLEAIGVHAIFFFSFKVFLLFLRWLLKLIDLFGTKRTGKQTDWPVSSLISQSMCMFTNRAGFTDTERLSTNYLSVLKGKYLTGRPLRPLCLLLAFLHCSWPPCFHLFFKMCSWEVKQDPFVCIFCCQWSQ